MATPRSQGSVGQGEPAVGHAEPADALGPAVPDRVRRLGQPSESRS